MPTFLCMLKFLLMDFGRYTMPGLTLQLDAFPSSKKDVFKMSSRRSTEDIKTFSWRRLKNVFLDGHRHVFKTSFENVFKRVYLGCMKNVVKKT